MTPTWSASWRSSTFARSTSQSSSPSNFITRTVVTSTATNSTSDPRRPATMRNLLAVKPRERFVILANPGHRAKLSSAWRTPSVAPPWFRRLRLLRKGNKSKESKVSRMQPAMVLLPFFQTRPGPAWRVFLTSSDQTFNLVLSKLTMLHSIGVFCF